MYIVAGAGGRYSRAMVPIAGCPVAQNNDEAAECAAVGDL